MTFCSIDMAIPDGETKMSAPQLKYCRPAKSSDTPRIRRASGARATACRWDTMGVGHLPFALASRLRFGSLVEQRIEVGAPQQATVEQHGVDPL